MYRKFCMVFALLTFSLMAVLSLFNSLVDPYYVWGVYHSIGFNQYLPKLEISDRFVQPIRFLNFKPETVFLGNSQVAWGIEAAQYTELTGKNAYNMGILGASMYEIRRNLEHAVALDENLTEVFINVNFEQFASNDRHKIRQESEILDGVGIGSKFILLKNFAMMNLSLSAVQDSLETIKVNRENKYDVEFYTPNGRWNDSAIDIFCKKNSWTFNRTIKYMVRDGYYESMEISDVAIAEMQKIVDICKERDIKLYVYILPAHARYMESYAPVWDKYEEWMRQLVKITPVTDFSNYNEYTMSVASDGIVGVDTNQYYWDVAHVKSGLGKNVIAELAGKEELWLGVVVNEDNVEVHLNNLKEKRFFWERSHPESVEEIRYFAGFSPLTPMALEGKAFITDKSVVRLNDGAGTDRYTVALSHDGKLDLWGSHLTPTGKTEVMYAVLEGSSGQRYYAFAEGVPSSELASFMHSKAYEMNGFHIQEPLSRVERGSYELYLLEVATNGDVYRSDILASVDVD